MIEALVAGTLCLLGLQFIFTMAYKIVSSSLITEFKNELEICRYNEKKNCDLEYETKIKILDLKL